MNKKSICLSDLRMRILSQDIAPGSGLDEVSLSTQYEISRTPLREILHRLAGDGYVCLLYTSPSPRDLSTSRMPSSA